VVLLVRPVTTQVVAVEVQPLKVDHVDVPATRYCTT